MSLARPPQLVQLFSFSQKLPSPQNLPLVECSPQFAPISEQESVQESIMIHCEEPDEKFYLLRQSLQFVQLNSLQNSTIEDIRLQSELKNKERQKKLELYRQKKEKKRQKLANQVFYEKKRQAVQGRVRINGKFISNRQQQDLEQVLNCREVIKDNNNMKIDLVSKTLDIKKKINKYGYAYIRKSDILKRVADLKTQQHIQKRIREGEKVFRIISHNF